MTKKLPFYILINDTDLDHIKFYHDFGPSVKYEGEFGDYKTNVVYTKARGYFHVGPKRIHYIETVLRFRDKIAKERNLPVKDLKIVRVEKSLTDTRKRIKNEDLKPFNLENIWRQF